jgi:two-component system cell cycle sensor histidine kinase/response regulator CckA
MGKIRTFWQAVRRRLHMTRFRPLLETLASPLDPLAQLLLDDAAGPALVIDRRGQITRANTALTRMLADNVAVTAGVSADIVFAAVAREAALGEIRPLLQGRGPGARSFATILAAPDGGQEVRATALPLRDGDHGVTGALIRFADISAQRRLEAQLTHSQKLQATGQLAGGIAHDFNNLLTAIIGAADGILEREQEDPALTDQRRDTIEDARQIRDSADRGAALVRQLLAFGRQQTLQPHILAVNDVIDSVSTLLRRLLGSAIRLELALEKPGRMVRADPTQLDQVLINLAVNARNAMPQGGVLRLRSGHISLFRPLAHGAETIPPGRYVMIEVQDSGIGIPPDVLPRIFDPFFTTRREEGGSGLGLSTVHGIVRQSEGFLAVESTLGVGTSVRIYLPRWDGVESVGIPHAPTPVAAVAGADRVRPLVPALAVAARTPAATPASVPPVLAPPTLVPTGAAADGAPCGTVLLVDDEEPVRKLAARALLRAGWRVLAADSGESALDLLRERHGAAPELDAVITDMMMPGMDGGTLLRQIREMFHCPDLPGILVSGFAQSELRGSLDADNTVFLAKPHSLGQLVVALSDAVSVRHPAVPSPVPATTARYAVPSGTRTLSA